MMSCGLDHILGVSAWARMASRDPPMRSRFPRCCHGSGKAPLEFHRYSALHCADYYSPRRLLCLKADALSSELREQVGNCTRSTWLRQGSLDEGCRMAFDADATAKLLLAARAAAPEQILFFKIQTPVVVKAHSPFRQPFGGENYLSRVITEMLYDMEDCVEDRHFVGLRRTYPL